jgi:hypothetical protein
MNRRIDVPVLDEPESAPKVLAEALGITPRQAREGLRALVKAGYVIGPREPTNAMLLAYITSYGQVPVNPATTITAVGKARRRWQAMAEQATAVALSLKRMNDAPAAKPTKAKGVGASSHQAAGGRARAEAMTPERRHEVAVAAAHARWGTKDADNGDGGENP